MSPKATLFCHEDVDSVIHYLISWGEDDQPTLSQKKNSFGEAPVTLLFVSDGILKVTPSDLYTLKRKVQGL